MRGVGSDASSIETRPASGLRARTQFGWIFRGGIPGPSRTGAARRGPFTCSPHPPAGRANFAPDIDRAGAEAGPIPSLTGAPCRYQIFTLTSFPRNILSPAFTPNAS
jgi:hypothetical protein